MTAGQEGLLSGYFFRICPAVPNMPPTADAMACTSSPELNIVVSKCVILKNRTKPPTAAGRNSHEAPVFHTVYERAANRISITQIVTRDTGSPSMIYRTISAVPTTRTTAMTAAFSRSYFFTGSF